jgi:hypothetical protein
MIVTIRRVFDLKNEPVLAWTGGTEFCEDLLSNLDNNDHLYFDGFDTSNL